MCVLCLLWIKWPKIHTFHFKSVSTNMFWLLFSLGTPLFGFGTLTKIWNMSTLTWHKTCNITQNRYISILFHRQRVNLHTKYMVSLSLHYLERENNITKKGNFSEKYEIFRETFHFFHLASTHLKTKWWRVAKITMQACSTETYS